MFRWTFLARATHLPNFFQRHRLQRCGAFRNRGSRWQQVDLDTARGGVRIVCVNRLTGAFRSRIAVAGSTESRARISASGSVPNDSPADAIRFEHPAGVCTSRHRGDYVDDAPPVELRSTFPGSRVSDDYQVPVRMLGQLRIQFFQEDALTAIVHASVIRAEDYVVQPTGNGSRLNHRDGNDRLSRTSAYIPNRAGDVDDFGLYARPVRVELYAR